MKLSFRSLAVAAITAAGCISVHAQQYPSKPVRFIIPFPPGGPTDIIGRMAADILTKAYGVQFVADNRAGAGGNIGTEQCAKALPDGYTVCMITVAQSISPAIYRKLNFDPVKDFAHVTMMAQLPSMLTCIHRCRSRTSKSSWRWQNRSPARCRTRPRAMGRVLTCSWRCSNS